MHIVSRGMKIYEWEHIRFGWITLGICSRVWWKVIKEAPEQEQTPQNQQGSASLPDRRLSWNFQRGLASVTGVGHHEVQGYLD